MAWLKNRFRYAFSGIRSGLMQDRSIRFQCLLGLLALAAGWILRLSRQEWLWILLSITLVITAEIFNSCIEKTVDYISLKKDPRAGLIKDMAASAVLVVSGFALIVALLIFLPALMRCFH